MKVEKGVKIFVLWIFLFKQYFAAPIYRDKSNVNVKLPFGDFLGMDTLNLDSSIFGGGMQDLLLNLPFADVGLPLIGGLIGAGSQRPMVTRRGPNELPMDTSGLGVINMPFAQFKLPLSSVTEARQQIPDFAAAQMASQRARAEAQAASSDDGNSEGLMPQLQGLLGGGRNSGGTIPGLSALATENDGPGIVAEGNLDTALEMKSGGVVPGLHNQMSLPLSVMNFPLNAIQTPLSHFIMPMSSVFNTPTNLPADPVLGTMGNLGSFGVTGEAAGQEKMAVKNPGIPDQTVEPKLKAVAGIGEEFDLVAIAAAALEEPNAIHLDAFSMPYSFLNSPLAYMNTPLSFVNLPFASSNLPFGHMNLPFSFLNTPFTELIQNWGTPALGGGFRAAEPEPVASPLDSPALFRPSFPANRPKYANKTFEDPMAKLSKNPGIAGVSEFLKGFMSKETDKELPGKRLEKPSDAIKLTDNVLASLFSSGQGKSADPIDFLGALASSLTSSGVPTIPNLGGLFGAAENAVFTSPYSLFNLPLGFTDTPMAFLNMPLSHFNLPISHLSMPFANLGLPFNDIATPEFPESVESAFVELSDIPPSLLELTNPENALQNYMNMPLSEMNLPLAVMDMPFTVFDMPFAFVNMPLAHSNNPFTHLHLPLEFSPVPLAEVALPFEQFIDYALH